jgi:hypothetical protein
LKQYLLGNKENPTYLKLYLESVIGIQKHLLVPYKLKQKSLYYLQELHSGSPDSKFEHLTCFVPGMLALGVRQLTEEEIEQQSQSFSPEDRQYIKPSTMLKVAKQLLETCVYLYESQPTGIGPDTVSFHPDRIDIIESKYLLRPETIESIYIMYQVTGDETYVEQGWKIFQSIERYCKTPSAYSGLSNVETGTQNNSMQSFFFAETLKYLFLLFSDRNNQYSFNEYVFNTEAHPFRIHSK